jgi:hypothetical protein
MKATALMVSDAAPRIPSAQQRAEQRLLGAAALGESHLQVSSLHGDSISIGAFQVATEDAPGAWRRTTGGREVACGEGFVLSTLALPHRSALVAAERFALAPEQVMNRAVRGMLAALRAFGLDPIYPGLDIVTVAGRAIAHVSFAEAADGPTLFQTILAVSRPLWDRDAATDSRPSTTATTLEVALAEAPSKRNRPPTISAAGLAPRIARGYADAFGLETLDLDPEVAGTLSSGVGPQEHPAPEAPSPAPVGARTARVEGRLGPVHAWAVIGDGSIRTVGVYGDFIAPMHAPARLTSSLTGSPATPADVRLRLRETLDGREIYLLGLGVRQVEDLLVQATTGGN